MRPSKKEMNSSWGRFFGSWGYTLAASDKKPTPQGDERSPSRAGGQDDSGEPETGQGECGSMRRTSHPKKLEAGAMVSRAGGRRVLSLLL